MTKRLVEINDGVLNAARDALKTKTIKDTVEAALKVAADQAARRRHLERFRQDGLADLRNAEVMAQAWQ